MRDYAALRIDAVLAPALCITRSRPATPIVRVWKRPESGNSVTRSLLALSSHLNRQRLLGELIAGFRTIP